MRHVGTALVAVATAAAFTIIFYAVVHGYVQILHGH
jgi:hypothetical protein